MINNSIKRLREEKGMTQRALAKKLNLRYDQMCRIEKSESNPTYKQVEKMAKIFGVIPDMIYPSGYLKNLQD